MLRWLTVLMVFTVLPVNAETVSTYNKSILTYEQLSKGNDPLPAITFGTSAEWVLITSPDIEKRYFLFFDATTNELHTFDGKQQLFLTLLEPKPDEKSRQFVHVLTAPLGQTQTLNEKYQCKWLQVNAGNEGYQSCELSSFTIGIDQNQLTNLRTISVLLNRQKTDNLAIDAAWAEATQQMLEQLRLFQFDALGSLPLIIQQKDKKNWLVLKGIQFQTTRFDKNQLIQRFKPISSKRPLKAAQ